MAVKFKPPFSFILCCYLLAALLFFSHGVDSRRLTEVQEDGNEGSKAAVRRSPASKAPAWVGNNPPPASTGGTPKVDISRGSAVQTCATGSPYRDCLPASSRLRSESCTVTYNRACVRNL